MGKCVLKYIIVYFKHLNTSITGSCVFKVFRRSICEEYK